MECVGKAGQHAREEIVGALVFAPNIPPSLLLSPILEATLLYYRSGFSYLESPRSIALDLRRASDPLWSL